MVEPVICHDCPPGEGLAKKRRALQWLKDGAWQSDEREVIFTTRDSSSSNSSSTHEGKKPRLDLWLRFGRKPCARRHGTHVTVVPST